MLSPSAFSFTPSSSRRAVHRRRLPGSQCVSPLRFSVLHHSPSLRCSVNILHHTSSLRLSPFFSPFFPPFFSPYRQLTSARLTPILSLFSMRPSPLLHFIIGSVLFYHPPPHLTFGMTHDCIFLSHSRSHTLAPHTHTFSLLIYSACVMSPSRLTAEVLMLRASGGYR